MAAISLSKLHSIRQISEELLVDYDDLTRARPKKKKDRKKVPPPTFIELEYESPVALSECVVEMEDGVAKVLYQSKDGNTQKTFDALDWLAQLVVHVPDRYEQTVRY